MTQSTDLVHTADANQARASEPEASVWVSANAGTGKTAAFAIPITLLSNNVLYGLEPFLGIFLAYVWIFGIIDANRRAKAYNLALAGGSNPELPADLSLPEGKGTITANIPTNADDMGLKVNVGIRPEDMIATDGDNYAYAGTVNIVEALGEVTQLYFAKSSPEHEPVIAKLQGIHTGVRGKVISMTADPSKVHLFADSKSLLYR